MTALYLHGTVVTELASSLEGNSVSALLEYIAHKAARGRSGVCAVG